MTVLAFCCWLSDPYRPTMANVTTVLDDAGVEYELLSHARTERAADEAGEPAGYLELRVFRVTCPATHVTTSPCHRPGSKRLR